MMGGERGGKCWRPLGKGEFKERACGNEEKSALGKRLPDSMGGPAIGPKNHLGNWSKTEMRRTGTGLGGKGLLDANDS